MRKTSRQDQKIQFDDLLEKSQVSPSQYVSLSNWSRSFRVPLCNLELCGLTKENFTDERIELSNRLSNGCTKLYRLNFITVVLMISDYHYGERVCSHLYSAVDGILKKAQAVGVTPDVLRKIGGSELYKHLSRSSHTIALYLLWSTFPEIFQEINGNEKFTIGVQGSKSKTVTLNDAIRKAANKYSTHLSPSLGRLRKNVPRLSSSSPDPVDTPPLNVDSSNTTPSEMDVRLISKEKHQNHSSTLVDADSFLAQVRVVCNRPDLMQGTDNLNDTSSLPSSNTLFATLPDAFTGWKTHSPPARGECNGSNEERGVDSDHTLHGGGIGIYSRNSPAFFNSDGMQGTTPLPSDETDAAEALAGLEEEDAAWHRPSDSAANETLPSFNTLLATLPDNALFATSPDAFFATSPDAFFATLLPDAFFATLLPDAFFATLPGNKRSAPLPDASEGNGGRNEGERSRKIQKN